MQWIRNYSLVKRMVTATGGVGLLAGGLGAGAVWQLTGQADALGVLARASTPAVAQQLLALQAQASQAAWWLGAIALAGVLLGAVVSWVVVASIKASVTSTVDCVVRIAGGDLETKVESPGRDEISWLRAELNGMRKKLRTAMVEVVHTVDGLNNATGEIAHGNLDLSSRTEEQARALQEAASTMQRLTETVRENAHSAQQARTVVSSSSAVAERGAQTMREVVERMGEINTSSSRITEIIGVIDGIAFQTNILALNAAVEAARAGDHGRGFAVVASEVRSLAQRSSLAAREIKTLIGDSSERVEAGSRLVDEAGRTMQEILSSVNEASTLIAEIAQAGDAQTGAIGQVHHAVEQIDGMTQQNAALVEQLAAAAQSLKDQSQRLTASMGTFTVKV